VLGSPSGGVVGTDPAGNQLVIPYTSTAAAIGAAPNDATYLTTANETARLANSRREVAGTNITFDDSVAGVRTISASGSGGSSVGGHLHGLMRLLGDGATTIFNLLDIAEYLEWIADNGSIQDPTGYTLSANRAQVTFGAAPTAGHILTMEYVIANV
jgi:hypothetical protein